MRRKSIPGRRNSKCKSPKTSVCWVCESSGKKEYKCIKENVVEDGVGGREELMGHEFYNCAGSNGSHRSVVSRRVLLKVTLASRGKWLQA